MSEPWIIFLAPLVALPVAWCLAVGGIITYAMIREAWETRQWRRRQEESGK